MDQIQLALNKKYQARVDALHHELNIPTSYRERGLPFQLEASELELGDKDPLGNEMLMTAKTAYQWRGLKTAAAKDGITLLVESAFRSLTTQGDLIRAELKKGSSLEEILKWIAAPGFSEHHTGRALDIGSNDCFPIPVSDEFEKTSAFQWLTQNAPSFGFHLSYPRGNPQGIIFEPCHWCFQTGPSVY